jgi:hypothetical protein
MAVRWTELEHAENQEIQRALEEIGRFAHRAAPSVTESSIANLLSISKGNAAALHLTI